MKGELCVGGRVGNSLFVFSCLSLIYCEQKSEIVIHSFPRENRSSRTFKKRKEQREIRDGSDSFLGIKMEKGVKNWQKHGKKNPTFLEQIARFLRVKEGKCNLLSR